MKKRATRGSCSQIAQADVLLVAAQVGEAEESGVDDADEAFGAAAMLHVGPAGLADGGHVEAVAALDEVLLWRGRGCRRAGAALLHALVLAPAAVFLLMFFDERSEGQFLEATTHGVLDPGRWTRCQCLLIPVALEDSGCLQRL